MLNIALVPGVLGFDRIGPLHYFNGVAPHLERTCPGVTARALSTNPTGSVAGRAEVLAGELVRVFGSTEPVHLLAHSMGGLDARYLVAKDVGGLRARVRSVVSIGTPHRGSPVASLLDLGGLVPTLPDLGPVSREILHELCANVGAMHDLSEAGAAALDAACPDAASVRYLEVVGSGRAGDSPTAVVLRLTYRFVELVAGANDGVVPTTSASRGRTPFAVWPADHEDLVGHDLDGLTPTSAPAFALGLRAHRPRRPEADVRLRAVHVHSSADVRRSGHSRHVRPRAMHALGAVLARIARRVRHQETALDSSRECDA